MSVHFPHSDLGNCYLCEQYYGLKAKAVWMADGYMPSCDECYQALNAATSDLHRMVGEIDENMLELDRGRVEVRRLISQALKSQKGGQP